MAQNAYYSIYKIMKTVFLYNVLLKSDWLVNKGHFPGHLIRRQNLKNSYIVALLLALNRYLTFIYNFI